MSWGVKYFTVKLYIPGRGHVGARGSAEGVGSGNG